METPYSESKQHQSQGSISSFYNDVEETLGKPNHYTIVMGDFNAQIGNKNKPYGNGHGPEESREEMNL